MGTREHCFELEEDCLEISGLTVLRRDQHDVTNQTQRVYIAAAKLLSFRDLLIDNDSTQEIMNTTAGTREHHFELAAH